MIKILYLTNTFEDDTFIEIEHNNTYNFTDIKFCGLRVDTNDNHIIYITKILKSINDKLKKNCIVLYNDIIIHINIDEYKLTINKIYELVNKFNVKQIDNYKILICKRYINLKKSELKEIIKLIDVETAMEKLLQNDKSLSSINNQINKFKNDLDKIKIDIGIFLCINNNEQFSLIISTLKLDIIQTFYTKEIISSMSLKKEVKEDKLKQNENKQFDLIDTYFDLIIKLFN
jgi:DNA integrity scanning protein DisA with diadenylate cyclase activity